MGLLSWLKKWFEPPASAAAPAPAPPSGTEDDQGRGESIFRYPVRKVARGLRYVALLEVDRSIRQQSSGRPATNAVLTTLLSDHKSFQAQYAYTHTNDPDADTMDDAWERLYFGSTTNANLTTDHDGDGVSDAQEFWSATNPLLADSDGDGMTDWQEFIAGTSGTNASSRFLISLAPNGAGAGNVRLSWDTVSNRFYRVYAGPSLFENWTNVYGVWGDGTRRNYTNQMPGLDDQFFRVGVELPSGP